MRAGLTDEQKEAMRGNACTVLDSWHLLVGLRYDGSIDGKELMDRVAAPGDACWSAKPDEFLQLLPGMPT